MKEQKKQLSYQCFLVGESTLTQLCADALLARGHRILGILTKQNNLRAFARSHNIPLFPTLELFEQAVSAIPHDLLLSIVNPYKLSAKSIQSPKLYAINYHDAPLPAYAGIHAASHAILNDETTHGITWHCMSELVDGGDILLQEKIMITSDETTASLNSKCFDAALTSFTHLLTSIENETCKLIPQDIAQRTYYGYHDTLPHAGYLDWALSAKTIDKYYRASLFGQTANRFGTLKCRIEQTDYVIKRLTLLNEKTTLPPGRLVACENNTIKVACSDAIIEINEVTTLDAHPIELNDVIKKHALLPSQSLPQLSEQFVREAQKHYHECFAQEPLWVNEFNQTSFWQLRDVIAHQPYNTNDSDFVQTQIKLPKTKISDHWVGEALVTVLAYFKKISFHNENTLTVSVMFDDKAIRPFNATLKEDATLPELTELLETKLNELNTFGIHANDLFARYPCLASLPNALKNQWFDLICYFQETSAQEIVKQHPHLAIVLLKSNQQIKLINHGLPLNQETLNLFATHIRNLWNNLKKSPHLSLLTLPFTNKAEEKKYTDIINNQTPTPPLRYSNILDAFYACVKQYPECVALQEENETITYQTLDDQSTQLAHVLVIKGAKKGDIIAFQLKRGITEITTILAILKCGAAYLPLEYYDPIVRVQGILKDAQVTLYLCDNDAFSYPNGRTFNLNTIQPLAQAMPTASISVALSPKDVCYVMYTSGTTGKPKGISIPHQGVLRLVKDVEYVNFYPGIHVAHFANPAFDASTFEIWGALLNGGIVYTYPTEQIFNAENFSTFITQCAIDLTFITAGLFNQLVIYYSDSLLKLKQIVAGGDQVNPHYVSMLQSKMKESKIHTLSIINGYGPTENTTFSIAYKIPDSINVNTDIPIGTPINHTQVLVVNRHQELLPPYFVGEILLSGKGLANGYLYNDTLTQRHFVPLNDIKGKPFIAYKTGDLGYYDHEGKITFVGRCDHQLKKNGFRIELGEIEQAIQEFPAISQCVTQVMADNDKKVIIAYYTLNQGISSFSEAELKAFLKTHLPTYMLPDKLIKMATIPLNANGKVDFKKLKTYAEQIALASQTNSNKLLYQILQKLIRTPNLSPDDDFFALGGDSITAMQWAAQAQKHNIPLKIADIFKYPKLGLLEKHLDQRSHEKEKSFRQTFIDTTPFELSPIQTWFFAQQLPKPTHFCQTVSLEIKNNIDKAQFFHAFNQLITQHPSLRLRFLLNLDSIKQYYANLDSTNLQSHYLTREVSNTLELNNETAHVPNDFDLENGPLIGCVWHSGIGENSHKVNIVIHHLLVDIVSWHILLNDLVDCLSGIQLLPPAHAATYHDWIVGQNDSSAKLNAQNHLPCAERETLPEPLQSAFILSEGETKTLIGQTLFRYDAPLHTLLLAIFAKAMALCMNKNTLSFNLETHGRDFKSDKLELSHTVGWFTQLLPMTLTWKSKDLPEIIREMNTYITCTKDRNENFLQVTERDVALNYWGNLDNLVKENTCLICSDLMFTSHSQNPLLAPLDINAWVKNKKLECVINFDSTTQDPAIIQTLIKTCYDLIRSLLTNSIASSHEFKPMLDIQRGILHHSLYGHADTYNVHCIIEHDEPLDIKRYKEAWSQVMVGHELLCSRVEFRESLLPFFVVDDNLKLNFQTSDWSNQSNNEALLNEFLKNDRHVLFDLEHGPLFRIHLIKLSQRHYKSVLTFSHIILDGWSLSLLLEQHQRIYQDQAISLEASPSFFDYVHWVKNQQSTRNVSFWKNYLMNAKFPKLPGTQCSYLEQKAILAKRLNHYFEEDEVHAITSFCKTHNMTLRAFFQSVWAVLLFHTLNQEDFVYGLVFSGRAESYPNADKLIGMISNVLPSRIQVNSNKSFLELAHTIQEDAMALMPYQHNSLYFIKQALRLGINQEPFDTIFAFENYPVNNELIDRMIIQDETHYPLVFSVYPNHLFNYVLTYHGNVFDQQEITAINTCLQNIIKYVLKEPNKFPERDEHISARDRSLANDVKDKMDTIRFSNLKPEATAAQKLSGSTQRESLRTIWKYILQQTEILDNDDFFELGGSSFPSLRLMSEVNHTFSINLPLKFFIDNPVLTQQAQLLTDHLFNKDQIPQKDATNLLADSLICLKSTGTKPPLFLIHPVGGSIFWFVNLAKYFKADHPLYAIQDPALKVPHEIHFKTVEDMAAAYIQLIKTVAPQGPYYLGGASAGATTSAAITHQLQSQGESVAFLGLFDGWVPFPERLKDKSCFEQNMTRQFQEMKENFKSQGIKSADTLLSIQWQRVQMNAAYRVPFLNQKITLFKAADTIAIYETIDAPYNYWETQSPYTIDLHTVPGDHESMFFEPNVKMLAKKLEKALQEANNNVEKRLATFEHENQ